MQNWLNLRGQEEVAEESHAFSEYGHLKGRQAIPRLRSARLVPAMREF